MHINHTGKFGQYISSKFKEEKMSYMDFAINYLKCGKNTTEMLWQVLW